MDLDRTLEKIDKIKKFYTREQYDMALSLLNHSVQRGVFDEDVLFHTFVAIGNHCTGNVCLRTLAQELDVYLSFVVPTGQGEGH